MKDISWEINMADPDEISEQILKQFKEKLSTPEGQREVAEELGLDGVEIKLEE